MAILSIKIEILGNPIPQKRTRSKILPGKSFTLHYDSQSKEKEDVRRVIKGLSKESNFSSNENLKVEMTFFMPYQKKLNTSEINAIEWGIEDCIAKPDLDNLAKFYLDCMNGIIYQDDCQVRILNLKKTYSNIPKTVIEIEKIRKINMNKKDKKIISLFSKKELMLFFNDSKLFSQLSEDYENVEKTNNNHPEIFERLLTKTASFLNSFSKKYAKTLMTISKIKEDHEL